MRMCRTETKKLLFVNRRLSVGGSERVMTILANGMAEAGIAVDMVVMQNMERTYAVNDKVNVIQFNFDTFSPIRKIFARLSMLRKLMKEGNYTAVISFMHIINFYTLIAGIGIKNVIVSERADPRKAATLPIKIGRKLLYPLATKLIFQTEDAKSCFPERIQKKGYIIPNPINNELPQPYSGERNKEIVAVGRFTEQKNFKMTVDAFEILHKEYPEYKLVIYGDGPLRKEIYDYAKNKGLEGYTAFPGFVKDIADRIAKAGVYVSSSNFEGISNSMLEALAMGIPSVCTDCPVGGAAMTIRNNENGILIPVGDAYALYEGMKKIIEDKAFAEKLSKNAVKIRRDLSIMNVVEKWISVICR